jgi:hypothetical protein
MRLSLQAASSSFNCTAYAAQAACSLNRRWRIIRPYRLNVVCLIMFETGTVGGRDGKDHFLSRTCCSQLFEYQDSEQKFFCRLDPLRLYDKLHI